MPLYHAPKVGLEKIKYLFIDGGCLDSVLERFSKELFGQEVEISYDRLAQGYQKVFYYHCLPAQKKDESHSDYINRIKPKIDLLNNLKSIDRFHVYEGTARFRDKRRGQEQKQVDIMIAVDMLTHSFRKNMHEATLIAGDLDFKHLIDALVQDGMHISLWYPKGRANYELVDAADSKLPLKLNVLKQWFTESFGEARLPTYYEYYDEISDLNKWELLEKIKIGRTDVFFYEKEGSYSAVISSENGYYSLVHDNLNQLKFYLEDSHSLDVLRPDGF